MEIRHQNYESGSTFEIVPTPSRRIIKQFIDHDTGYLVVMEIKTDEPTDTKVYYTLLNPETGSIISPQQRLAVVGEWEKNVINEEQNLRLTSRRTIDVVTGKETLHETLVEASTGKVLSTRKSLPFCPVIEPNLLDNYLKIKLDKQQNRTMESNNYAQKSIEEKKGYWLHSVMLQMRFQGEWGLDEYSMFTPENYAEWLEIEPEIDQILDFVIEHIPDDTESVRAEINQRLQR